MIPGALLNVHGIVRLREPAHADRTALLEQLREGSYTKPFVMDDGAVRSLHFGLDFIQSEMSLSDPYALTFRYTQKMMAFLLFQPRPRHVVIVGLGGGSLTKFCHRQLPRARITTVEIDREVIACGELFDLPPPSTRMRILNADARDYFAGEAPAADVVLLDGCDLHGTAPAFRNESFYRRLRSHLRPHGLLVANITGSPSRAKAHLELIGAAFSGRVIVTGVRGCANRLAFAFNDGENPPDWEAIAARAEELAQQHGLDFHDFAHLLQRSYRRAGLRTTWRGD